MLHNLRTIRGPGCPCKKTFEEADDLRSKGTREALNLARERFEVASNLFRDVKNSDGEGRSLVGIGIISNALGNKQDALKFYNLALPLFRALDNKSWISLTLNNIGSVYQDLGKTQKALDSFLESLPIARVGFDAKLLKAF